MLVRVCNHALPNHHKVAISKRSYPLQRIRSASTASKSNDPKEKHDQEVHPRTSFLMSQFFLAETDMPQIPLSLIKRSTQGLVLTSENLLLALASAAQLGDLKFAEKVVAMMEDEGMEHNNETVAIFVQAHFLHVSRNNLSNRESETVFLKAWEFVNQHQHIVPKRQTIESLLSFNHNTKDHLNQLNKMMEDHNLFYHKKTIKKLMLAYRRTGNWIQIQRLWDTLMVRGNISDLVYCLRTFINVASIIRPGFNPGLAYLNVLRRIPPTHCDFADVSLWREFLIEKDNRPPQFSFVFTSYSFVQEQLRSIVDTYQKIATIDPQRLESDLDMNAFNLSIRSEMWVGIMAVANRKNRPDIAVTIFHKIDPQKINFGHIKTALDAAIQLKKDQDIDRILALAISTPMKNHQMLTMAVGLISEGNLDVARRYLEHIELYAPTHGTSRLISTTFFETPPNATPLELWRFRRFITEKFPHHKLMKYWMDATLVHAIDDPAEFLELYRHRQRFCWEDHRTSTRGFLRTFMKRHSDNLESPDVAHVVATLLKDCKEHDLKRLERKFPGLLRPSSSDEVKEPLHAPSE
eukprot:TRINITY_DN6808_c0_g1_i1.p1 TRINITY_DN6808_c0_g1~~TRINITY_DN6808_c0_g1_i1.p1  ORF type:complete len:578 (-),score=108.41 TRINITY_DN6808_c0_g1_i1:148-1881(-)